MQQKLSAILNILLPYGVSLFADNGLETSLLTAVDTLSWFAAVCVDEPTSSVCKVTPSSISWLTKPTCDIKTYIKANYLPATKTESNIYN